MTTQWTDAWAGYIEPGDHSWRVTWYIGSWQLFLEPRRERRVLWQRIETAAFNRLQLGLIEEHGTQTLVLGNKVFQLTVPADTAAAHELLKRVASTMRRRDQFAECRPPMRPRP